MQASKKCSTCGSWLISGQTCQKGCAAGRSVVAESTHQRENVVEEESDVETSARLAAEQFRDLAVSRVNAGSQSFPPPTSFVPNAPRAVPASMAGSQCERDAAAFTANDPIHLIVEEYAYMLVARLKEHFDSDLYKSKRELLLERELKDLRGLVETMATVDEETSAANEKKLQDLVNLAADGMLKHSTKQKKAARAASLWKERAHQVRTRLEIIERCNVCLDNPRNILLQPCSHLVLCEQCCNRLPSPKKCPICSQAVESTCKVYIP